MRRKVKRSGRFPLATRTAPPSAFVPREARTRRPRLYPFMGSPQGSHDGNETMCGKRDGTWAMCITSACREASIDSGDREASEKV